MERKEGEEIYGEYELFIVKPIGLEVIFRIPVVERTAIKWAFISGISNLATLFLAYLLLLLSPEIARVQSVFLKVSVYYLAVLSLLLDAFNLLSVGPFIYGAEVNGIAVGFVSAGILYRLSFSETLDTTY